MRNNKEKDREFKLSFRLYDEKFNKIFDLNKENYKKGLKQIDKMLRLKFDESIEEILKK
jgi:hypothetical protein